MKKPKKNSNRSISLFTYVFFLLFLGMIGYYVYFLYADSETFASNSHNPRLQDSSANVIRGSIESSNGKVLASTETAEDGTELRDYPYGRVFAHIIGYSTNGKGTCSDHSLLRKKQTLEKRISGNLACVL